MATIFDATINLLDDSQLEDEPKGILWSPTSLFHRNLTHLQRGHDDKEYQVRESKTVQDSSEFASVGPELLQLIGLNL